MTKNVCSASRMLLVTHPKKNREGSVPLMRSYSGFSEVKSVPLGICHPTAPLFAPGRTILRLKTQKLGHLLKLMKNEYSGIYKWSSCCSYFHDSMNVLDMLSNMIKTAQPKMSMKKSIKFTIYLWCLHRSRVRWSSTILDMWFYWTW